MLIVAVGVNHRTAPVEIREKLSFPAHSLPKQLQRLHSYGGIEGCAIISTCNRTEIYVTPRELDDGLNAVWDFLSNYSDLDSSEIKNCTFCHTLYDSVRHLFRVSAGLDSMILGETQILGQVRQGYEIALQAGTTNRVLNTLFQQAITVGKRVRHETGIDKNAVSVSYAAVELAKQKFGDLNGRSVLVVGAGKMSELTAKHLVSNGVSGVIVSNRSYDRAEMLAEKFQGRACRFEELFRYMKKADIVISSTAASHYVIRYPDMCELINANPGKKLMFIDIAVPRDVDPQVNKLPGVTLYDIDDLQNVVDNNLAERRQAAVQAEKIIEEELDEFLQWLSVQLVVPTIVSLKEMGEEIKKRELERALNRLGNVSDREYKIISSMANSIMKQLLHFPIVRLKEYAVTNEGHLYTKVLQNLFNLEVDERDSQRYRIKNKGKENVQEILTSRVNDEMHAQKQVHSGGCQQ
ncbi:glutamyl-tRNA reductase [Desulfohalotomaculum tongense]|uniref:glutamyl-tRNA reductase n=1 Tax=Desulforadius tongensis TaxID=1216062 RepID=UPI001959408B|nr:glutamyl-tRNA reductase [Desulforadius tongensis]MBM7855576.1 glutamyl-tRNA reductase [Desulforadius tongensis]